MRITFSFCENLHKKASTFPLIKWQNWNQLNSIATFSIELFQCIEFSFDGAFSVSHTLVYFKSAISWGFIQEFYWICEHSVWIWCMHLEIALSDIQCGWIHAINTQRKKKSVSSHIWFSNNFVPFCTFTTCTLGFWFLVSYQYFCSRVSRLNKTRDTNFLWNSRFHMEYLLFYLSFSSIIFCTINFALKSVVVLMSPATWYTRYQSGTFTSSNYFHQLVCNIEFKKNTHFVLSFVFVPVVK